MYTSWVRGPAYPDTAGQLHVLRGITTYVQPIYVYLTYTSCVYRDVYVDQESRSTSYHPWHTTPSQNQHSQGTQFPRLSVKMIERMVGSRLAYDVYERYIFCWNVLHTNNIIPWGSNRKAKLSFDQMMILVIMICNHMYSTNVNLQGAIQEHLPERTVSHAQCCRFSRNIAYVTPKISYFYYQENY